MPHQSLLCPQRLRRIPRQFSWIDQRLVREGTIRRCDPYALALYLFLVTVADAQGLSYYANHTIADYLSMKPDQLSQARQALMDAQLIAFAPPLYQVLALDSPAVVESARTARPQSLGALLRQALEKQP